MIDSIVERVKRRRERQKKYYESHKEYLTECRKKWSGANSERQAESQNAWRTANPEYMKAWREGNPEYQRAYLLSLAERNPNGYVSNESRSGENHHNWKGGVAKYPKQSEFKVNRLIVLNDAGWKCDVCGRKANTAHHLDGSKDNHTIENLLPACTKCHKAVFHSNFFDEWVNRGRVVERCG